MIILTIKTDNPQAEIGLFEDAKKLNYVVWAAHKELADTLHVQIKNLLQSQRKDWSKIDAVLVFKGPGSFTGLRIGFTVANTLAYAQKIPIVAYGGETWLQEGINQLLKGQDDHIALPEYGSEPNITQPKK